MKIYNNYDKRLYFSEDIWYSCREFNKKEYKLYGN